MERPWQPSKEAAMKRLIRWLVILGVIVGIGWTASGPAAKYMKERNRIVYREGEVVRGSITAVVNSTGTVKPVQLVQVGSFVSGPIKDSFVDFNSEVEEGELLAIIDPQIFAATVASDRAALESSKALVDQAKAQVDQAKAKLQQAINDEARALALRKENKGFISESDIDKAKFDRLSLAAALATAEATVLQAQAALLQARARLELSEANLRYTDIYSPVNGIVVDRKIDPGQTVASQFQTPVLYTIASDMRKEIYVLAAVDEADIGQIRRAHLEKQPVRFTVDAEPDDLFQGTIFQIRMNSTTTQNVVTYPVVISTSNPDLKLKPDMTASISFQVGEKKNVLRIPNAALRFYPQREQVRPEDRKILEGAASPTNDDEKDDAAPSASEKALIRQKRNRRHVWIADGEMLRAVEVVTGINDSKYTELVSGDLQEGQKLVTGIQPKN
jgi:HlyD family secretion protein